MVLDREEEILRAFIADDARVASSGAKLSIDIRNARRINELSALITFKGELEHTVTSTSSEAELSYTGKNKLQNLNRSTNADGEIEIEQKFNSFVEGSLSITFDNAQPSSWSVKECPFDIFSDIKQISISIENIKVEASIERP